MAESLGPRYERYAKRFDTPMLVLAFTFLVVWSSRIIFINDLPQGVKNAMLVVQGWIWLAFLADLIIRTVISEKSWKFLWTHPLDVLAVLYPPARPLRILTIFTQGTALASARGRVKTTQAVIASVVLLLWIGAVSVLSAERDADGSQIHSFGDALWWSIVTVTTVGYGDFSPVTVTGRIVATVMMLIGIALIGVVTASVAAWFVSLTSHNAEENAEEEVRYKDLVARIGALELKIGELLEREHRDTK